MEDEVVETEAEEETTEHDLDDIYELLEDIKELIQK